MYTYETVEDIVKRSEAEDVSFAEVVLRAEEEYTDMPRQEIMKMIKERIRIFRDSIQYGLKDKAFSPSGMCGGQSATLMEYPSFLLSPLTKKAMAYAVAVSEANAKMHTIVACPTAGSCGIMPGCMIAMEEELQLTESVLMEGFLVASGIGNVVMANACIAGAVGGCQAECGTAVAMTAGAIVSMLGGNARQIGNGAALALKNVLGLVCDPVAGLVEVPCVKRNGLHAIHSLGAAHMALAGLTSSIPVDEVILAMDAIGRALPSSLRETSEGGLASTPTGRTIADQVESL